ASITRIIVLSHKQGCATAVCLSDYLARLFAANLSFFDQRFSERLDTWASEVVFDQVPCSQCEPSVHELRFILAVKAQEDVECSRVVPVSAEANLCPRHEPRHRFFQRDYLSPHRADTKL